jgi:hypothetical protein
MAPDSRWLVLSLLLGGALACARSEEVDRFNFVLGTQAIGGRYQFTGETRLVESARLIRALGSHAMKFTLSPEGAFGRESGNIPERPPGIRTLADLAADEPSHRAVLDMPFGPCFLWAYPFTSRTQAAQFRPEDREAQYAEMKALAAHLLRTYRGTGKQFFLGHWEGDWHLRPGYDPKQPIPEGAVERFVDWLRVRQRAIDDAKRETPHHDVAVWHVTEVNLVAPFVENGGPCLTNLVLPEVDVDYVSYSCYDAIQGDIRAGLFRALDHIEAKLRPKPGIPGKRVFIGEYGFPARIHGPETQNRKALETMIAAMEWGCPFVLYWQLHCNEVHDGRPGGFWLIDDRNEKQPVWHTHERYYRWARQFVRGVRERTGKAPTDEAFRAAALPYLREALARAGAPESSGLPPMPPEASLAFDETWESGRIDPARWYALRKQWGAGNHGVVPENVGVVREGERFVLQCEAHGDDYDGPVTGQWGRKTRVGGVLVTKPRFASGRFEVRMKIGTPERPHPAGCVPAIWTYGYRAVRVDPAVAGDFVPSRPLYHPYLQEWGPGNCFYWSEIDFPEFGHQGEFGRPMFNTFLNKQHDRRTYDVFGAADGQWHTWTTEWRTGLVPLEGVTDAQVTEAEGYFWAKTKDIPYDRHWGNPMKRLGPDRYAACAGTVARHWVDGRFIGENPTFVPAMSAQLNLGVWLPDWAGPAAWNTATVRFGRIRVWQYGDPGDVTGVLRHDIGDNFDAAGQPVDREPKDG